MNNPNCDSCGQEMTLEKRLQDGINIKGQKYRRRRFKCDLCVIHFTMYCDGTGDEQHVREAVENSKNPYK